MSNRWSLILVGLVDLLFGILLLSNPAGTIGLILLLFGFYAILSGGALIIGAFTREIQSFRWLLVTGGIISVLIGILALFYPTTTIAILVYFIAFRALFVGIFEFAMAIQLRREVEGEFWLGAVGVMNFLFGLIILFYPVAAASVIILLLGWYSVITGIVLIIRSFLTKSDRSVTSTAK